MTNKKIGTLLKATNKFSALIRLIITSLALISMNSLGYANNFENDENSAGELLLTNKQGKHINTLLLDTDINVNVNGLIATSKVKQTFRNDSDDWVNGRYVFPLPENGAIDGLTIKIGERVIHGVIKEKHAAKTAFVEAKKAGKKASLLEQHRPNLFSMSVANIPPRSEVQAEIHIIDRVKYDQQTFSLRLPTTLTPRYTPGKKLNINLEEKQDVPINEQSGWGVNTHIVPNANKITPPQTYPENIQTPNRFRLQLELNAGVELSKISSKTHALKVDQPTSKRALIRLQNKTELMNKDVVLEWTPIKTHAPVAALFQQTIQQEHYVMAMLLPPTVAIKNSLPRDITFIIDSSGSMSGNSMKKAKESLIYAIQQLRPSDRFNVIDFDNEFTPFYDQPVIASVENISNALIRVKKLIANGGTEMFGPLAFAFRNKTDSQRLKQIVFMTDGAVNNEQQLFRLIHSELGDARLFTVGIGTAPNSHFMSKAAQFGRGSFTYIDTHSDSIEKMNLLFKKINHPIARDIQLDYQASGNTTIEQYPTKIPDLYAGEPLIVLTKSNQSIDTINIIGNLLGNSWQRKLKAVQTSQSTDNIDALWARKKVSHLMDQLHTGTQDKKTIKPQVIELGIKHHLLTQFTSFVAIEKIISKPAEAQAKSKKISNLMPKGSTMPVPQTATTAGILSLFGSLLMFFAMLFGHQRFRQSLLRLFSKQSGGHDEHIA